MIKCSIYTMLLAIPPTVFSLQFHLWLFSRFYFRSFSFPYMFSIAENYCTISAEIQHFGATYFYFSLVFVIFIKLTVMYANYQTSQSLEFPKSTEYPYRILKRSLLTSWRLMSPEQHKCICRSFYFELYVTEFTHRNYKNNSSDKPCTLINMFFFPNTGRTKVAANLIWNTLWY